MKSLLTLSIVALLSIFGLAQIVEAKGDYTKTEETGKKAKKAKTTDTTKKNKATKY